MEAAAAVMRWTAKQHGVKRFAASVQPDNPSLSARRRQARLRKVGQQMDDVDGLEDVFER